MMTTSHPDSSARPVRPALQEAQRHLQAVIDECIAADRSELPTIDALASGGGVSRMTMWQALAQARQSGAICSCRGRRIRLAGTEPRPVVQPAETGGRRWRRLAAHLEHAVLSGVWHPGEELPSIKDLLRRHGVSYRTLRRALTELVSSRVLQPYGNRHRVPLRSQLHPRQATVVLIAAGSQGVLMLPTPRSQDHIRLLEAECSRSGVRLSIMTPDMLVHGFAPAQLDRAGLRRLQHDPPLGFLLWRAAMPPEHFCAIAALLRKQARPIAVLDETGDAAELLKPHSWPSLRVLSMAVSPLSGEEVGRYLLGLGHRRIAFVSTRHTGRGHSLWRLSGLRTVYTAAGLADGVQAFTAGEGDVLGDLVSYARLVQSAGDSIVASGSVFPAAMVESMGRAVEGLRQHLRQAVQGQSGWRSLADLFARVLADREVTAWVGDADPTALECLDFLRSRGVKVPQQVSVIGFDDGMAALLRSLTSYNFNGAGAIRAMMAHVLASPRERRAQQRAGQVSELAGRIVERGTTARAPARRACPPAVCHQCSSPV